MASPKAALRSAPGPLGAVENRWPPNRPRPAAEPGRAAAGGGVNEPDPRLRPEAAAKIKRMFLALFLL